MISQYQLTHAEATEAAAALGKSRANKPWRTSQCQQTNNSYDATEHTISSTHEDSSDTCFSEELKLHAVPMIPVNYHRRGQPMTKRTSAPSRIVSTALSRPSLPKSTYRPDRRSVSPSTPLSVDTTGSLESRIMKRYKISYKEALEVTSKARRESSKRYISVEDICHEIINGVESDFRTVKLRPVATKPRETMVKAVTPREQAFENRRTKKSDPKTPAIELSNQPKNSSRRKVVAEERTKPLQSPRVSEAETTLPTLSNRALKPSSRKPAEDCEGKSAVPSTSGTCGTSCSSLAGSSSGLTSSESSKLGNNSEKSILCSSNTKFVTSSDSTFTKNEKHVSFDVEEEEGCRRISITNLLPESYLMSKFNLNIDEATILVEEARMSIGAPTWIPTGPEILEACSKLAIEKVRAKSRRKKWPTINAVDEVEAKPQVQLEAQSDMGKPETCNLHEEPTAASELIRITTNGFNRESETDFIPTNCKTTKREASTSKERIKKSVVQCTTKDNKTLKHLSVYGDHLSRPLESVLAQRYSISWNEAKQIVQKGRCHLDMAQTHAWNAELEKHCEEKCLALTGHRDSTTGESENLSVVYSVDVKDLSESETEIGKSWISYSVEECSLVSRCPSRNQDVIYIERGSLSCHSGASTQLGSEAFDIPCLIYIRVNEPPEVPADEPLEAVLGMPFLHRRRSKQLYKKPKSERSTTVFHRLLAKVTSKVTGTLSSDSSECRKTTLVDL